MLGACVGSFALTVARRHARGESGAWLGRSRCETCGGQLGLADLVPLWSWLRRQGRCRHCAAPIAPIHPAAELVGAAVGAIPAALLPTVPALLAACVGWWLLGAALVDLHTRRLPDVATLPLLLAGITAALFGATPVEPVEAALGAAVGYTLFWVLGAAWRRWRGVEALGLGDAKLLAAAGAWLGPWRLPELILAAALLGIAQAALGGTGLRRDSVVVFGPALALAFWAFLLSAFGGFG